MVPVSARVAARRNRFFALRALWLTGLVLAVLTNAVQAQYFPGGMVPDAFDDQTTSGVVLLGREHGLLGPYANTGYFGPYLRLQHIAGDGPGYRDDGYTSLGVFVPRPAFEGMLFTDGQLSVNNVGDMLGSVGGGYRYYMPYWNRVVGSSFWYDIDGGHRGTFSQIGLNFESRGENWDFFANLYLPVGRNQKRFNSIVTPTDLEIFGFDGRNLTLNRPNLIIDQFESAMRGVDAELGGPLPYLGQWGIRGYGGYYHFNGDNVRDVHGGRFRLQAELTESLVGQFLLTHDNQFDTNAILNITWLLPGSGASRSPYQTPPIRGDRAVVRAQSPEEGYSESQRYRMFQPVQRSSRVFVNTFAEAARFEDRIEIVTDPLTGQPIVIFHADSRAAAGGDGSFERPFNTLAATEDGTGPGAVIFVHAGSVFDNPANNFIALQSGQQFLGEGVPHFISTAELGTFRIPRSGRTGPLPRIEGAPANAITLANDSLVSGFTIANSGGAGIFAGSSLTGTANVDRTTIVGGTFGLDVLNATGTINFADTTRIRNTTGAALNVDGAMTTARVNFDGRIENSAGRAIDINRLQTGGRVTVNGQVTDNGGTGIRIRNSDGNVTIVDADLTIPNGDAVTLADNTGIYRFGTLDVTTMNGGGLIATNSGTVFVDGGNIDATGGPAISINPTIINLRFNNVSSTNSNFANSLTAPGIRLVGASGLLSITGNTVIDSPLGNGIEFIDSSAAFTIANLDMDNTGAAGIFLQDTSGAGADDDLLTGTLTVEAGSINGAGGVSFDVMGGSANTLFQGDINHDTVGTEIVRVQDTNLGNIAFNTGTLTATAGNGILLRNADGRATFNGTTTITGTTRGVLIDGGSAGTFTFSADSTITDTTNNAFEINNSSPNVLYAGVINQSLAARAVEVNAYGATGRADFTGTINATGDSTGFRILNSPGRVNVENYIAGDRDAGDRLMNRALEINNSSGIQQFENLDLFTMNGEGVFVTNPVQQGTFRVANGRIDTMGESAIDIFNTNIGIVNFTEVIATNTGGNIGVSLNNVGLGTFIIDELTVNNTGGADGLRIAGPNSTALFLFGDVDISETGGGDAIEFFNTPADALFARVDIDDTGAGGRGIQLDTTTGFLIFESVDINNTGAEGVRIEDNSGLIVFDDDDPDTTNDLTISMTNGNDAIFIVDPDFGSFINFAGVDISDTGGGNGIHILRADGTILFDDGNNSSAPDVTITNTMGGDGILIDDPSFFAEIAFSTVDINDTGAGGNGVSIIDGRGRIAFGDTSAMTTGDLTINTVGAGGNGINIINPRGFADISFSSVDIETNMGNAINIAGTGGLSAQGIITFDDGNAATDNDVNIRGTGGGDGIAITNSGLFANYSFSSVDITNTMMGNGVTIQGTGGLTARGTITFDDGVASTTDDLNISNTGGGAGIEITNSGAAANFSFSSVDITDTDGGNGVVIQGIGIGQAAEGTITFDDGDAFTTDDLNISNTGGGNGLVITNSGADAFFTFAGTEISDTGGGNGVTIQGIADPAIGNIAFNDRDEDDPTGRLVIFSTGGGNGIEITNSGAAAEFTFFNVDISNTGIPGMPGMGGDGVLIQGAEGAITFSDEIAATTDLVVSNTDGGTGLNILDAGGGAAFTFARVNISNTGGGRGVNIEDAAAGGVIVFDDEVDATLNDLRVSNTGGGEGLRVAGSAADITFAGIDISNTGTGDGVLLENNTAAILIEGGDIRNAGGAAFHVDGGAANVTYDGTISANTMGLAVEVEGRSGGTIAFNGAILSTGAAAGGISITGSTDPNTVNFNAAVDLGTTLAGGRLGGTTAVDIDNGGTASTVTFANLDIFTDEQIGLQVQNGGGGTLTVTTGRVDTVDGIGVNLDDIASNVTLTRLLVNGAGGAANDAVAFNDVTGTFSVNGDTEITAGGTGFQNGISITGGTGTFTFSTAGANATTITGATLNGIDIDGAGGAITFGATTVTGGVTGINIANTLAAGDVLFGTSSVSGVTADAITLSDNNGDFTTNGGTIVAAAGQNGIFADYTDTTGDITIDSVTINGAAMSPTAGIAITNSGNSTFEVLINNTTIGTSNAPLDGVALNSTGTGTLNATLTNNDVVGINNGLTATTGVAGTMQLNIGTNQANGAATGAGLENDFSNYVFTNDNIMRLGVSGNITAFGAPIPDVDLLAELEEFDNTSGGGVPDTTRAGANQLEAADPTTIPVP